MHFNSGRDPLLPVKYFPLLDNTLNIILLCIWSDKKLAFIKKLDDIVNNNDLNTTLKNWGTLLHIPFL